MTWIVRGFEPRHLHQIKTGSDTLRWSIEELIYAWGMYSPWNWRDFFLGVPRRFRKRVKLILHWLFRGYTLESLWSLNEYLMEIFIYRLKAFKNSRYMSYPGNLGSQEEWNEILDRMIKGFEVMKSEELAGDYPEITSEPTLKEVELELGGITIKATALASNLTDREKEAIQRAGERQNKYDKETLELFTKYFHNLWD